MGFEDYSVILLPTEAVTLQQDDNAWTLDDAENELRMMNSFIVEDKIAISKTLNIDNIHNRYMCYNTDTEIFQILLNSDTRGSSIRYSLRFAYCNPRTIYLPFCKIVRCIMQRHQLSCYVMRDLDPSTQTTKKDKAVIEDPSLIEAVLVPSIDHNRLFWQADAKTTEEAALRPEEAIEHFIVPLLMA